MLISTGVMNGLGESIGHDAAGLTGQPYSGVDNIISDIISVVVYIPSASVQGGRKESFNGYWLCEIEAHSGGVDGGEGGSK